jgi:MFS family permease
VLGEPNLQRLLAGQLTSFSGDFIVIAALPFAVFSIGGSGTQVSIAFGVAGLFEVALVLFGGAIGDRFTRRSIMIAADLTRLASQAILAALLISGEAQFWQLLLVQVVQGGGAAFFNPSMSGLVPEVVPEQYIEDANALLTIVLAAGAMLGPALAGAAIALGSAGWAFAVDALTFGVSAALLARIRIASPSPAAEGSLVGVLVEGWGHFRRQTWLWIVVLEFSLLNALVFGPFQVLGASAAEESLGGPGSWALILAAAGGGRLVGGLIALIWRPRRPLLTSLALLVSWVAPLTLLAIAAPLPAIAGSAFAAGATIGIFGAIWHSTMQTRIRKDQLSRMSSYDWLGSLGLLPFGYAIASGSQALIGGDATLIASALIVVTATAIVIPQAAIREIFRREPQRRLTLVTTSGTVPFP